MHFFISKRLVEQIFLCYRVLVFKIRYVYIHMNVLGISRSPRFSPNSVDRDMAIFTAVASRMQRGGNDVSIISEDLFIAVDLSEFDLVFQWPEVVMY